MESENKDVEDVLTEKEIEEVLKMVIEEVRALEKNEKINNDNV